MSVTLSEQARELQERSGLSDEAWKGRIEHMRHELKLQLEAQESEREQESMYAYPRFRRITDWIGGVASNLIRHPHPKWILAYRLACAVVLALVITLMMVLVAQ